MFYLQLSGSNQVIGSCLSNLSKLLQIRSLTQKLKFILILGYAMSLLFLQWSSLLPVKKKKNTNYLYAQWLQHDQKFLISCHLSEGHYVLSLISMPPPLCSCGMRKKSELSKHMISGYPILMRSWYLIKNGVFYKFFVACSRLLVSKIKLDQ